MHFALHHLIRLRTSAPVRESQVQILLEPRGDHGQRLIACDLRARPRARLFRDLDGMGNAVHHFDVPGAVSEIVIIADSLVETAPAPMLGPRLEGDGWAALRDLAGRGEFWDFLQATEATAPSAMVKAFIEAQALDAVDDPLAGLHRLVGLIHRLFEPIAPGTAEPVLDKAIGQARIGAVGAAHLALAVARGWGVPARFVRGYVADGADDKGRLKGDGTHAWIEAHLPGPGWVGFDPLRGEVAGLRHVRLAFGRDMGDVDGMRHVFKGEAETEIATAVTLQPTEGSEAGADDLTILRPFGAAGEDGPRRTRPAHLQAAQQQQ